MKYFFFKLCTGYLFVLIFVYWSLSLGLSS